MRHIYFLFFDSKNTCYHSARCIVGAWCVAMVTVVRSFLIGVFADILLAVFDKAYNFGDIFTWLVSTINVLLEIIEKDKMALRE